MFLKFFLDILFHLLYYWQNFFLLSLRDFFLQDYLCLRQGSWVTLGILLLRPLFNEQLILLELSSHLLILECLILWSEGPLCVLLSIHLIYSLS